MNDKKIEKDVPIRNGTPLISYESGWGPNRTSQEKALGNYTESVSKRLETARKARCLSLRDIARITETIEVSASTIRNYETRPSGFRQIQLGIVQALSMALEYDVRALLCLAPFDSDDDEGDLERASLEPTCEGVCWLLEENAPEDTRLWEIYEHRNDLSLIVIKEPGSAKVDPTDRRHAVPCDASGAYDLLTLMLCLEQGYATTDDPAELSKVAARLKPHISNWNTISGKRVEIASTMPPVPLHRRRLAREKATLSELGDGWAYRESDGERCPYLKIDAYHEAEVRGFVPDFGATCEVSLWHVPNPRNPEEARETGQMTGVTCNRAAINAALNHLRTHAGDTGTYRIDFRGSRKITCKMNDNTCPTCGARNVKRESTKYNNDEVSQGYYCSECGSKWTNTYFLSAQTIIHRGKAEYGGNMSDTNKRFDLATWLDTHQYAKVVVEDTARKISRPQPKWRTTDLNWCDAERRRIMGRCESLSLMCGGKASPNEWRLYIDDLAKLKEGICPVDTIVTVPPETPSPDIKVTNDYVSETVTGHSYAQDIEYKPLDAGEASMKVMTSEEVRDKFGITPEQIDKWESDASNGMLHGKPRCEDIEDNID